MNTLSRWILSAALLAALPAAQAAEPFREVVPVGRVKVVLSQPGWKAYPVQMEDIGINKGIMGSVKSSSMLFIYRQPEDPDTVRAALLVYTTPGIAMPLRTESSCEPVKGFYVRDYTNGARSAPECLHMYQQPVPQHVILERVMTNLRDGLKQSGQSAPFTGYPVRADIERSNAAVVYVEGIVADGLVGLPDVKPAAEVPEALSPALAAWTDALGDAAQNALKLFRDEFPMPKVEFRP
jgi:hypothetical protein